MTEADMKSTTPKGGRWLRWLLWLGGGLVVLVVVLYFVGNSSAFFKGVILPRIGAAVNANVSVADAEISPFSKVVLHDVRVTPQGAEPVFAATSVTARYSLLSILRGNIVVDELTVVAPSVTVIENADGKSNLDLLLKSEKPAPTTKPSPPPSIDLKSVRLDNATVRYVKNPKGGGRDVTELASVKITASNIKNGESGKLDFSAAIAMDKAASTTLQAKLGGGFTFTLTKDLKPGAVQGGATLSVDKATGDFADLAALAAKLDCEVTPTEIKRLALVFTRAGAALGEVRVSGPFDSAKTEGKLKVEVLSLDRQVLNLAGAAAGIDFGTTTINANNDIELTKGGAIITAAGTLTVARFQVTRQKQTSPTLDLRCDYSVTVNRQEESALIKTLNLTGTQDQRPLLQGELTNPMTIAWGNTSGAVGDATLNLALTGLNLADWKAFTGEAAPGGTANLKLKVLSQQAGKALTFELDGKVDQFSAGVDKDQLQPMDVVLLARGKSVDLKQFNLSEYRLELAQQNQSLLAVSGAGTFDRVTQDADLQVKLQAALARAAILFSQTNVTCSAGTIELTGHVTKKQQTQTVTCQLVLADFTGGYGDYRFANFGTAIDLDVVLKGSQLEIRKATGQLRQDQAAGGKFDVAGNYDLDKKSGQLTAKLTDFKENDLRPILQPSLGDKKLISVSLATTSTVDFNANGDATVKADAQFANLVVQDPKKQLPAAPLEMHLMFDAAAIKRVATVRQCQLTLTPTARAKNELRLIGSVDYSNTDAITGSLKFAADALDATAYYDLFAKPGPTGEPSALATPAPTPKSAAQEKEPEPVLLPVRNFTCEVAIGRLYLREVDIANFQTTAKLDGGHVVLKPCQLTLNGAPVSATVDLDLGVPGYKYDIVAKADKVPLVPLVNSFSPTYRDKANGDLIADIQVKGAGLTGRSLHKNLSGQITVTLTNANIQIVGPKVKKILTPIALVLGAPELISSPLDSVNAAIQLGDGKIETRQFTAHSDALLAESQGTIPIADVLMDSPLSQPVEVSLPRALATRLRFGNVPAQAPYMKLPTFVHLDGTFGDPTAKTDKAVIVELTASGIAGAVGGKAGGILGGLGGLLGGQAPASTATNPSPAEPSTPFNPFDLLKRPKK